MQRHGVIEQIPALHRYARARTGDAWASDDLVQDTVERACGQRHLWRAGSGLRAWLFSLMHNLFANQARSASRRVGAGIRVDPEDVASKLRTPNAGGELALDLQQYLLRLPTEPRAVLLILMEDLTYEEVGGVLAIPVGTVMFRLSRGGSRLRKLLDAPAAAVPPSAGAAGLRRLK